MYNEVLIYLDSNPLLFTIIKFILLLIVSIISYSITKHIVVKAIKKVVSKTKTDFDDILLSSKLLNRISLIVPLLIISSSAQYFKGLEELFTKFSEAIIALLILLAINTVLSSLNEIYDKFEKFKDRPIKGYVQIIKIIINIFGGIIIIGLLADQSPWTLLSAVSALTAVLLLIFKDTILSFVASIQISSYDLIKVGDWIEVPQFGADGDIVDIALHTVKVQNFDKTITVIPTYKLIESAFKNWRGMQLSGGRRIKRSIYLDQASIKFCDAEMLEKFRKIGLLKNYIENKLIDIDQFNKKEIPEDSLNIDKRRLTNIGTFRAYLKEYLKKRKDINDGMTFLIRQLAPGPNGLAIELYIFTTTTNWVEYEDIQADIFDHILAIVNEFDLRLFQNPTGNDFRSIVQKK
ncbi:MAG: mechanosensitive ion channel [Melioribacteraceae bacterium]|nr:mechanosensitive ion channel [Melioribacteraceae bacterium]